MKNNKIAVNYIYNLVYQILLVISPVITMPFLARALGVEGIGKYSYAYSLLSYFVLVATLGCDIYGRREIAYVKDDIEQRSIKFWNIQIIKIISTFIVLIMYIIFSSFNVNKVILLLLIFHLINVPLNIGWFFQGIEEFKKITIRGFFLKIVDLMFVILFIHKPSDLNLYVCGSSIIAMVTFLILWIDLKKYIYPPLIKNINIKENLSECFIFFLPSVATSIYTLLDKTMIGVITKNYVENGYYEQAQKINVVLLKVVLALGVVLLPQIAKEFKNKNFKKINNYINKSVSYVFFISFAIAFGLMSISRIFVPWFFGNEFDKVSDLLKISGFILIFQGIDDVLGLQYLVSIGKQKLYIISLFVGAFVNFLLNIFFIKYLYSIGALIASLLGEIAIVIVQMFFVRKEINIKNIILKSLKYFLAGTIMGICCMVIFENVKATIINTIIVAVFGGTIYIFLLYLLKDEFLFSIFKIIKNRILR